MPKWVMVHYWFFSRKFVWFGIIWFFVTKTDFWVIFPTQILSKHTYFDSELINHYTHGFFQNFRNVPLNWYFFKYRALELKMPILMLGFIMDMKSILDCDQFKNWKMFENNRYFIWLTYWFSILTLSGHLRDVVSKKRKLFINKRYF